MIQYDNLQMEVDTDRGVIYIHSVEFGQTILRISGLRTPIRRLMDKHDPRSVNMLDVRAVPQSPARGEG